MYSAHFTFHPWLTGQVKHAYEIDHRILLVFALQCAWSARLTYQSARRGFLDPCVLNFSLPPPLTSRLD
jgi:steroid 5-alpha reductase family enzyme